MRRHSPALVEFEAVFRLAQSGVLFRDPLRRSVDLRPTAELTQSVIECTALTHFTFFGLRVFGRLRGTNRRPSTPLLQYNLRGSG
jgi:hypothetical protein